MHLFAAAGCALAHLSSALLRGGWPVANAEDVVSVSTLTAELPALLILGHDDGAVCKLALPGGLALQQAATRHRSRVTALLSLRASSAANGHDSCVWVRRRAGDASHFVSASSDGEVWLWELHTFRPYCIFREHCRSVNLVLRPPARVPACMERWFVAISDAGSISVYDPGRLFDSCSLGRGSRRPSLDAIRPVCSSEGTGRDSRCLVNSVRCVVVLRGQLARVRELVWHPAEGMLCVRCAPRAQRACRTYLDLYAWAIPAGRLERVLSGPGPQPHLHQVNQTPLTLPNSLRAAFPV